MSWRSLTKIAGSRFESGSISQRYGFVDPDPHQKFMDPQHWLKGSGPEQRLDTVDIIFFLVTFWRPPRILRWKASPRARIHPWEGASLPIPGQTRSAARRGLPTWPRRPTTLLHQKRASKKVSRSGEIFFRTCRNLFGTIRCVVMVKTLLWNRNDLWFTAFLFPTLEKFRLRFLIQTKFSKIFQQEKKLFKIMPIQY